MPDEGRRLRGAGRKAADLDQHEGQPHPAIRKAVAFQVAAAELTGVLPVDVGEIQRGRRLVGVQQRVGLLGVLPVQPIFDPLADDPQILERDQAAGVPFDEGAFGGEAGPHVADLGARVAANARREIVQEALTGGQTVGATGIDQQAQILQPGHPMAQLLDGDHAGRVAREQLFDVAAEVPVERRGAPGRRNGEQQRHGPEQLAVAERPSDVSTGQWSGRGCG
jgi:hypothetical protein